MPPLSDVFAALRWWFVLMVIGSAAAPLAYYVLGRLPDRGYAFTKMLGLLLVGYLFWLLGSLGILANNVGGILFALLLVVAVSFWAYRRSQHSFLAWLRENRRYVLLVEGLFLVMFLLWSWVRAQNPAITATEKPMELAFLNAVGRSPAFPPQDPWLSGYAISYYYFGYVMTSALARLASVPEAVGFNLGIAWLVAATAVGAFGLVYNLIMAGVTARWRRAAVAFGLVAAVALPVAGNGQMLLELMHGNSVGSPAFWSWLDIRDVNVAPGGDTPRYTTSSWWWWRSSRVIHEYHLSGRAEEGLEPIAEFPGFSFVLGDMHPHVLALPFAFVSLGIALAWWRRESPETGDGLPTAIPYVWERLSWANRVRLLARQVGPALFVLTIVVLGGLSFLNTWDVLIHLFVVLGAFALSQWRLAGKWEARIVKQTALVAAMLVIPAVLLYLPFYLGFRSQAGPPYLLPTLVRPTRLTHYLVIFGMSVWAILFFVGILLRQARTRNWRVAVYTGLGLLIGLFLLMLLLGWIIAVSPDGSTRVTQLATELGLALAPPPGAENLFARLGWAVVAVISLLPPLVIARLQGAALTLLLAGLAGLIVMLWVALVPPEAGEEGNQHAVPALPRGPEGESVVPFVLLLVLTGVLLSLGPEFVYLRDNFGQRLNTIFKFYYQTWVLFGVSALYGLYYLLRYARTVGRVALGGYALLLFVALLFPIFAGGSRASEYAGAPTLDGMAYLTQFNPDERAAISWLAENAGPADVVLEAVGGQYSGFARISAHTGLPTVLGWAGHEYQWRGDTPEPGQRDPAVRQAYTDANWDLTREILNRYDVDYVYVGPLETATYGPQARDKFAGRLDVAYANDSVTIYRWLAQ